jgi:molecular chaperone DnaJ
VAVQADWREKDLYNLLGVPADADDQTIRRAYRKLARELHPDTHPDDPDASERFKEVTAAYDVIGDVAKRAEYDEFRRAVAGPDLWEPGDAPDRDGDTRTWTWFQDGDAAGGEGRAWETFDGSAWTTFEANDLDDLLGGVLGRSRRRAATRQRGDDLESVLVLEFEDAIHGLTTDVTLDGPAGRQRFKVRVPAGVNDGQRIRLPGKGGPGINGGPAGDLYALVRVKPHPVFGRRGDDLTLDAPISWPEAVLGTDIEVPTLAGPPIRVRVPAGTPHGRTLRVRGHGVRTAQATGDLLVGIRLTVPDHVTEEQRQAVEAVAAAFKAA